MVTNLHRNNSKSNSNDLLNANINSDADDEEINSISFSEGTENVINIVTIHFIYFLIILK